MEAVSQPHCFAAASLPTKSVVVFCDRAEVKRLVVVELSKGTHEILIQNVSAVIERQSVRVDGRGVMIQEVQYQEMPMEIDSETAKTQRLEKEKANLENEKFAVEDEICSLLKRIDVLDGVAAQIASGPQIKCFAVSPAIDDSTRVTRRHTVTGQSVDVTCGSTATPQNPASFLMGSDTLANLSQFLQYYGETVSGMKSDLRKKQRESERIVEKLDVVERQIDQFRCGAEYDSVKRNILIVVEMDSSATVELYVSYQVYCASWKPAFDIRASTAEEADQATSVQLCYYGLVEQNTGDDWRDCDVVLSTAAPSIGGSPPYLGTLTANIHRPNRSQRQRHASARRKPLSAASEEDMGFGSFDYNEIVHDAAALHRYNTGLHSRSSEENSVSVPGTENLISTCFSIPRTVTILSNGAEHKLLVATLDLSCAFWHECVPCRSPSAFLWASVTNTSTLALLPGPASVYVNNCFVTKTHLRLIVPGEEFRCSLGVDPSLKVEYKTPQITHDQVGFMSKSTLLTHEQQISLRSAKVLQNIKVTVKEQVPKSKDDKVKVSVVSPELKSKGSTTGEARLNKEHNLEWTVVLAPGQTRDLFVRYTVEYPANENLTYKLV